jgi:hypothetical protein
VEVSIIEKRVKLNVDAASFDESKRWATGDVIVIIKGGF